MALVYALAFNSEVFVVSGVKPEPNPDYAYLEFPVEPIVSYVSRHIGRFMRWDIHLRDLAQESRLPGIAFLYELPSKDICTRTKTDKVPRKNSVLKNVKVKTKMKLVGGKLVNKKHI